MVFRYSTWLFLCCTPSIPLCCWFWVISIVVLVVRLLVIVVVMVLWCGHYQLCPSHLQWFVQCFFHTPLRRVCGLLLISPLGFCGSVSSTCMSFPGCWWGWVLCLLWVFLVVCHFFIWFVWRGWCLFQDWHWSEPFTLITLISLLPASSGRVFVSLVVSIPSLFPLLVCFPVDHNIFLRIVLWFCSDFYPYDFLVLVLEVVYTDCIVG